MANSIIFFNTGLQVAGTLDVTYSAVEDGYTGEGNIALNPVLKSETDLIVVPGSPCIDAGNPDAQYYDECFPLSLGTQRNDMGANGGPGGCAWDNDFDGVLDGGDNCRQVYNPGQDDSDSDSLGDACEAIYGTNLLGADSDDDGLTDGEEVNTYFTNPTNPDSDGDGYNDGLEISQGTQPRDGNDFSGIPNSERTALIALYNSTDGDNWTDNSGWKEPSPAADGFALPGTECLEPDSGWYGITCTENHVTTVSLTDNQLTESIPEELSDLTDLQYLYLDENQLEGSIPATLGSLTSLVALDLDTNRLSGNIPDELGDLDGLVELNLDYNQLSGTIPETFGDLENLRMLNLWGNKLTGPIPATLGSLGQLFENEDGSDIRYNALYTDDPTLREFLETIQDGGDWESTQTVAPTNLTATVLSNTSVQLTWTRIPYSADAGGYEVWYAETPGGPYTILETETTADKSVTGSTVTGLTPGTDHYFFM